ncbi:MAG: Gfo/Idh/MocA family oxidoreductase, partial [Planctomycetota bacterium]|nr:Gfo/Idh/MocA family oxidoreductase [Planctomycetota bacterium]
MPKPNLSRRNLLKVAGAAAAAAVVGPYIVPASARGAERIPSPSNRVTMGWIGVGGRGGALLSNFLGIPDAQVLALCDVKKANRDRAQAAVNKQYDNQSATTFVDFRELLARQDIDSVVVASTDHWHVPLALAAVRAGKDVYCEKPLGVSVEQDIALRNAVQRYGRVFQFGTQERSSWSTRQACEIVQNGWIGKVHTIKVGTRYSRTSDNYPAKPAPAEIDYDMWLGPAPVAPYCDERVSNSHWFHISDYSLGFIAGCGIHTIDMATWGNGTDLTGPLEVEGTGEFPRDGLCDNATAWNVNLKFANGVLMNFTDGQKNPLGVRF